MSLIYYQTYLAIIVKVSKSLLIFSVNISGILYVLYMNVVRFKNILTDILLPLMKHFNWKGCVHNFAERKPSLC